MASKKKKKAPAKKKVVAKAKKSCTQCGKAGHNARSHQPGGKLDPNR